MEPAQLGIRNLTDLHINTKSTTTADIEAAQLTIDNDANPELVVAEERKGWKGYVEWENYPDKKVKAHKQFQRFKFPPPPEFQLGPIPDTNPVLEGIRWKLWHKALGGALENVPEESWEVVLRVCIHGPGL